MPINPPPRKVTETEYMLRLLFSVDALGSLTAAQLWSFAAEQELMDYVTMRLCLHKLLGAGELETGEGALADQLLLTDRGRLVICCANIESLAFRFSRGAWGHLDQPRHFCMYSPMTVRRLLTAGGLVPGPIAFESQLWKSEMFFAPFALMRSAPGVR